MTSFLAIKNLPLITLFSLLSAMTSLSIRLTATPDTLDHYRQYSANLKINNQPFELVVDTGKSYTWVVHSSCTECRARGVKTLDIDIPEECNDVTIEYDFRDINVTGCLVDVSLELGQYKLDKYPLVVVPDAGVWMFNEEMGYDYSGYFGIPAFNTSQQQTTVMKTMVAEKVADFREVGLFMPSDKNSSGEMNFGDPAQNGKADTSKMVVVPNVGKDKNHFDIKVDLLKIGDKEIAKNFTARLDSSLQGIKYPSAPDLTSDILNNFYQMENNLQTFMCNVSLPRIAFTIAGQEFEMKPETTYLKYEAINPEGEFCRTDIRAHSMRTVEKMWYFGNTFFHNVYPSFNIETGEIKIYGLKA